MASKVRRAVVAIAYALVGAVLFGGGGIVIGIAVAPDDGLQAVFNAAVGAAVGGLVGAILGVGVFVAGTKALEAQTLSADGGRSKGTDR